MSSFTLSGQKRVGAKLVNFSPLFSRSANHTFCQVVSIFESCAPRQLNKFSGPAIIRDEESCMRACAACGNLTQKTREFTLKLWHIKTIPIFQNLRLAFNILLSRVTPQFGAAKIPSFNLREDKTALILEVFIEKETLFSL